MTRVHGLFQKSLKNRSSKNLRFMTGAGTHPAIWSWSNEALKKHSAEAKTAGNIYDKELQRRESNAKKRKTPRPVSKKNTEVK